MTHPPTRATLANDPTPWAAAGDPSPAVLDGRATRLVPTRVVAAARHPESIPTLLLAADAAAVAAALGIAVQLGLGAPLRPPAILAPVIAVMVAKASGLYARPGRGLGQSTLG